MALRASPHTLSPEGLQARVPIALVFAVISALTACAPEGGLPSSTTSQSIVGGQPHSGDPAVVALVRRRVRCREPFIETFCTGVLVGERVVLTAAHCLSGLPPLDLEVFVGSSVNEGNGRFYAVAHQQIHPDFSEQPLANDLALLQLTHAPGITPVEISNSAMPMVNGTVRVVGFGGEGNGSDGIKRQGTSRVAATDLTFFRTEPMPALGCGGDSGAPVFVDSPTGARLVGLIRSGDATCRQYANATLLAPYADPFLLPYVSRPPAPTQREASLSEPLCAQQCERNEDCPRGMLCLPERSLGRLCGYASIRSGQLGITCTEDSQCNAGTCAASGAGDEGRTCGCFVSCRDMPQGQRFLAGGAGCSIGFMDRGPRGYQHLLWLLVLPMLGRRRRTYE